MLQMLLQVQGRRRRQLLQLLLLVLLVLSGACHRLL